MQPDWPEISDLIIDYDPTSLARRPVQRSAVLKRLQELGMTRAYRIVHGIAHARDCLDGEAVDHILLRAHTELQRLSLEFRVGEQLARLLRPLVRLLLEEGLIRVRIVDIGCGQGYGLRWLAAHGRLPAEVELVGCDYNACLIASARRLAEQEGLAARFLTANALRLDQPAHIFISTGVLHHFRGQALDDFLQGQWGARALLHLDVKASWAAYPGAWVFHQARMREALARHDGVLSAVRAHPGDRLLRAARRLHSPLKFSLLDGQPSLLPIFRTLNGLVGLTPSLIANFQSARMSSFA
ncbi:MAG: class I SAM-dependent methyltransferase [Candidatus Eremiobacteraeota bacterium]|nr:class I SAM-dependent methyltransferase [Candidatus Eremiobacteraeota bacterium]MCW5868716.1 class I SAM-dependent methyltransferase [Candidatus Eremiobacteraeota bacterium]